MLNLNNKDEREDFYEAIFILCVLAIIAGAFSYWVLHL